jgi:hypothetical protein
VGCTEAQGPTPDLQKGEFSDSTNSVFGVLLSGLHFSSRREFLDSRILSSTYEALEQLNSFPKWKWELKASIKFNVVFGFGLIDDSMK